MGIKNLSFCKATAISIITIWPEKGSIQNLGSYILDIMFSLYLVILT